MSFFRRNKERIIVALVAIILIIIISVTVGERSSLTRLEKFIGNSLSPISKGFNKLNHKLGGFFSNIGSLSQLRTENEQLRERVTVLESENRKYENIIGKTDYLKEQYELEKNTNYQLKKATVTGKDPENYFDRFNIDKGIRDGVKVGDILIQAVEVDGGVVIEGLVGRVIEVGDNWSKVVTIIDEANGIAFKILRTQDGGVVTGNTDHQITGYLYDDKSDVVKGDRLYTSGLGGKYIKDIYIGEVEEVKREDEEMVKSIKVKPAINFKKIYNLYILSNEIEG